MEINIIIEIGFHMENLMEPWTTITFFAVMMPHCEYTSEKKSRKYVKIVVQLKLGWSSYFFYMKLDVCIIGNRWELFQPYLGGQESPEMDQKNS